MRFTFALIISCFLITLPSVGNISSVDRKEISKTEPIPTENDALKLASLDILTVPIFDRQYIRYIWIVPNEFMFEDMQIMSLTLNYISRGTVPVQPIPIGKDKLMLVRLDLRAYAPKEKDLEDLIKVWEEFRFDPRFNLLLTKDTIKFAIGVDIPKGKGKTKKREFRDKKPYYKDGKNVYWDDKTEKYYPQPYLDEPYTENGTGFDVGEDVIRIVAPHLDPILVSILVDLTRSQAPVVNHRYFLFRALSTLQDKGLYKDVFGGLYYQLAGIKKGAKKGTDEDVLLEQLGIGNVEKGINAKKIFDELRSDQRVAVFRSGITGKPRRVDILKTLAGRDSQGIVSITHDLKAQDIDVGQHPILNLLDFKDAAREVIFEKTNGLHGFALFNGNGELQDVVPADVAVDNTIPFPNRAELQPAIGCIRCHAKESGLRFLTNDVKELLKGINIFDDKGERDKSQSDIVDRLAGLYGGDLEIKILPRARDDYNSSILKITGPWKKKDENDQTRIAKYTGDHIAKIYSDYFFSQVRAIDTLHDFGIEVKDNKEAQKILTKLLPPVPIDVGGFIPEDARLVALKVGLSLNRTDYDLLYSFIKLRLKNVKK